MKVTVCELPDDRSAFKEAWEALCIYVRDRGSELVLLPELPFSVWFPRTPEFEPLVWQRAQEEHEARMKDLMELAPAVVLGTHMLTEHGLHLNRGFAWTEAEGYRGIHDKHYFPNEENFYERNWFDRNQRDFTVAHVGGVSVGFLICTEVMFNEWARYYGRQGANVLATPRAAGLSYARWEIALRMAAISSGAFVLSSNRADGSIFGGRGMVIDPEGTVLAVTSPQMPFVTVAIDLEESVRARQTYPRDVLE